MNSLDREFLDQWNGRIALIADQYQIGHRAAHFLLSQYFGENIAAWVSEHDREKDQQLVALDDLLPIVNGWVCYSYMDCLNPEDTLYLPVHENPNTYPDWEKSMLDAGLQRTKEGFEMTWIPYNKEMTLNPRKWLENGIRTRLNTHFYGWKSEQVQYSIETVNADLWNEISPKLAQHCFLKSLQSGIYASVPFWMPNMQAILARDKSNNDRIVGTLMFNIYGENGQRPYADFGWLWHSQEEEYKPFSIALCLHIAGILLLTEEMGTGLKLDHFVLGSNPEESTYKKVIKDIQVLTTYGFIKPNQTTLA